MKTWNETLDEIARTLTDKAIMARLTYNKDRNLTKMSADIKRAENQAKSALNNAVKEIVQESKPESQIVQFGGTNPWGIAYKSDKDAVSHGYNQASDEYELNLIKAVDGNQP